MQERIEREVQIVLDEKSIKVLKELSKIHINSFINYCLRLGEQSELYEILCGKEVGIKEIKLEKSEKNDNSDNSEKVENKNTGNSNFQKPKSEFSVSNAFADF